jgi:hypothetical protein
VTLAEMKNQKIEQLAREYRAEGYEVRVHAQPDELPEFLRDLEPDIVATSSKRNIVSIVTSAPEFDRDRFYPLVQAVEAQPGWKLEVSMVSHTVAPDVPAREDLAADDQIERLISNAELLVTQNQTEAAALLAWSAVEAILRRRARSAAPDIERESSARVLTHLYSLGRLQPELYEKLLSLMRFRNAVGHGFAPRTDIPGLPEIITDIRRMKSAA